MCFPGLPLVLAAVGSGLNYFGQQRAQSASNRAQNMERSRQQGLERQQDAALGESERAAMRLRDPNAQAEAVGSRREAFIRALNSRSPDQGILPGAPSAPRVVADAAAKTTAASDAYGESQASALAELTAMGDQLQGTNIAMGRQGQRINQLGTDRRRSAQVLDAELQAAANKGSTLRGLGGLLQQLGSAAGAGGGGGSTWMPSGMALPGRMGGIY